LALLLDELEKLRLEIEILLEKSSPFNIINAD
jgi:hypothetical protein